VSRPVRVLGLVLVGLVLGGVCATAGVWQWNRFEWKRSTNDELRASAAAAPVPVDELLAPGRPVDEATELREVTATGRYDGEQLLVRRRSVNDKPGFLVLAPLRTSSGTTLVVNRGFVPANGPALDTPPIPQPPAGEVRITGRVVRSEDRGLGSGLPDRQVQNVDVGALAGRWDVRAYGGYVELVGSEPADTDLTPLPAPDLGNPAGGAVTGQHLAYVFQWFVFAGFALAGPAVLLLLDRRARRARTAAPAKETQPA
jgi:cytochrome oxidase assembly protein ShyY1